MSRIAALPLFPLQSVLFPGGLLVLKVFEARYLDLMTDCLRRQQPFGVVCLLQGGEVRQPRAAKVRFERSGVLARLDEVDSEQPGLLRVRCTGTQRFRRRAAPTMLDNGLWVCPVSVLPGDTARMPGPAMLPTVQALAGAIKTLAAQGRTPFAEPYRLDDAGWVANRWCELLPVPLSAKQKLMELDDPQMRLRLVQDYLRGKGVVQG